MSVAEAEAERTRSALDAWRSLQEQDNALATRLADIAGQTATAASRRDAAAAELGRLDQREAERSALLPEAETVAALAFEVTLLDEQRERAERLRSLQVTVRAASERIDAISRRVGRLVSERLGDGMVLDGWCWGEGDSARPETGIERLLRAAASLDARDARDRVDALRPARVAVARSRRKSRRSASDSAACTRRCRQRRASSSPREIQVRRLRPLRKPPDALEKAVLPPGSNWRYSGSPETMRRGWRRICASGRRSQSVRPARDRSALTRPSDWPLCSTKRSSRFSMPRPRWNVMSRPRRCRQRRPSAPKPKRESGRTS